MSAERETIGVIAGGGAFPLLIADAAAKSGLRVVAVAHQGQTDPALEEKCDDITWVKLGQFKRLIGALRERGATRAVMAGTISKQKMFELRPDRKGLALMTRLAVFHDDDILRAVADELYKEGIEIVSSTQYLPELLAPWGCLTRRRPTKAESDDIRLGWKAAMELGRLDIGQCVVVRDRTVLAVEAMEGTDETIRRGTALAREKAVVVKISKPRQDLRFDVPSVGLQTVEGMARCRATVLAVEAEKTLLFDRPQMLDFCNRNRMSVVGCRNSGQGPVWDS